jgi:serine O-acetyltransferase
LTALVQSDLFRVYGRADRALVVKALWGGCPGFRYLFWHRLVGFLRTRRGAPARLALILARRIKLHYRYKYGLEMQDVVLGCGCVIVHCGAIVVNGRTRVGRNLTIFHGVTIGASTCGPKAGVPTIGDGVWIGPGAKIFGKITIGNNVAIGANAVVMDDLPDNAVAVGIPARVVSHNGAARQCENIVTRDNPLWR